jgi:hypothetical protein
MGQTEVDEALYRLPNAADGGSAHTLRLRSGGDVRRIALRRGAARFFRRPAFERRVRCDALRLFKLTQPVFGDRGLGIAVRLRRDARVSVRVLSRGRVVRRYRSRSWRAGPVHRLQMASGRRGDHRVVVRVRADGRLVRASLVARRL